MSHVMLNSSLIINPAPQGYLYPKYLSRNVDYNSPLC